jgi:hypothetical protein
MADIGGPIGSVLLLGVDDEVTYRWFHEGVGAASINANAEGWRMVTNDYADALVLVARALAESEASWSGVAGEASREAVSPVRAWAEHALESAVTAQSTVLAQSDAFSDIKSRLSPPVAVPDKPWFNDIWPGETNYDRALAAKQANSQRNVELVRRYGDLTDANGTRYPSFDVPVRVATDVSRSPERDTRPVPPRDGGAVERFDGPRTSSAGGDPARPASPVGGPGQPTQPSTVDGPGQRSQPSTVGGPGQPGAESSGQQVSPSQSVPGGPSPAAPSSPSPAPGQEPAPPRHPGTGVPVTGLPRPGFPEAAGGGRVPGERTGGPGGRHGGGSPGGHPGPGARAGGGTGGMPAGEAVAGRGGPAGGVGRGAGAGHPGGFVPAAGRAAGDEDTQHTNKFGPADTHDEFWEAGVPVVAPQVIGVDEEE